MRSLPECYGCLLALIEQTTALATNDERLRGKARERAQAILEARFADGVVPARIASIFHEEIKRLTGNADPFLPLKRREMALARQVAERSGLLARALPLREAALVAVAGNAWDFFREHELVARELEQRVRLAIDHLDEALGGLAAAQSVLYLADNAGEQYFDRPLLAALAAGGLQVAYGVKGYPVQNDLAINDVEVGLLPAGVRLVSTGGAAVGCDLAASSPGFRALVEEASLVVAKGMGHFETLDELAGRRVLLLAKAKCRPVAAGLGVAKDSFVALLARPGGR